VSEYQLLTPDQNGPVCRTADNAWIPAAPGNPDWEQYQTWLKAGGVPDPYVPPPETVPEPIPGDTANARLDTGVNSAVDAYNANTPPVPLGGQGDMTADERLLRLEESLKAMCNGHMAYLKEPPVIR
jgi:hypothetical protein